VILEVQEVSVKFPSWWILPQLWWVTIFIVLRIIADKLSGILKELKKRGPSDE